MTDVPTAVYPPRRRPRRRLPRRLPHRLPPPRLRRYSLVSRSHLQSRRTTFPGALWIVQHLQTP